MGTRRWKIAVALLSAMLLASLAAIFLLCGRAGPPLSYEGDRPLIERTRQRAATIFRSDGDSVAQDSVPIVLHLSDRTCVVLGMPSGGDPYLACDDRRTLEVMEERASVS